MGGVIGNSDIESNSRTHTNYSGHFRKGISKTGALAWVRSTFSTDDTVFIYMSKEFVEMLSSANIYIFEIKSTILHEVLHLKGYSHSTYDRLIDAGRSGLSLAKRYAKTPISRSNLLKNDRRQTLKNPYNYEAYYLDRGC